MPPPYLHQLRRDKTLFGFGLNVRRLDAEEDAPRALEPGLREPPDNALPQLDWTAPALLAGYSRHPRNAPEPLLP